MKVRDIATGILRVKHKIRSHFVAVARLEADLDEFKAKHGYCTGRPYCMNEVPTTEGERRTCDECREERANPQRKKKLSAYGRMRKADRAAEKSERRRKAA